jgi:hypothetical protein
LAACAGAGCTMSQCSTIFGNPGRFLIDFMNDSKVTPSSRSLTVDLVLFGLGATILMVIGIARLSR